MELLKTRREMSFLILWFTAAIYPLVVIPYKLCSSFPSINQYFLDCFYAPRYIMLAVLGIMSLVILSNDRIQLKHPAFIPLGLFIFFGLLSTLFAPEPVTAWIGNPYRYTGYTTYLFCLLLFILAYRSNHAEQILKYAVCTAVLVSFIALLQYLGYNPVPHEPYREGIRSYSTLGNPDFLGSYQVFILPAAMFFYLRKKKLRWLISSALIYLGLIVCQTRSSWIAFFTTFTFILLYALPLPKIRKPAALLLITFFVIFCLCSLSKGGVVFLNRAGSIAGEASAALRFEENAGNGRVMIWKETLKLLPAHWAFGLGPDHLGYAGLKTKHQHPIDKAHNIFLEIAITMGVFALLFYLAFLSFFLSLYRTKYGLMYLAMILAYIIQGLFSIEVVLIMPLFWIVLGFSLRYTAGEKEG
ncbi:O-antigen polymerase [Desulfofarcimen acetoxidans DSM 771]|uniref:O-antigen polymerase n=1 Tax=Desulfofarcimen acetoxidans (strain ATCC 49208 / DSM 771 / KCTC 5769 / VKM B-1644 / 5575) TaxID=485916 RepID=C8W5V1_DESAS|nr:O-antigen ligase family protein [Desulfofarcimen acetoxidans]ACV64101.1 O-antigen polymerase [Desulfofarcimen acetoxidans DSM 771]